MAAKIATGRIVGVDELIDSFLRDTERALQDRPRTDLLRAPVEANLPADFGSLALGDSVPASAGSRTLAGKSIRLLWPIASLTGIAAQLARNHAGRTAQNLRDAANRTVGIKHGSNLVPFFFVEVRVVHRATPTWWLGADASAPHP